MVSNLIDKVHDLISWGPCSSFKTYKCQYRPYRI